MLAQELEFPRTAFDSYVKKCTFILSFLLSMPTPESSIAESVITVFGGGNGWGKKIASLAQDVAKFVRVIEKEASEGQQQEAVRSSDIIFLAAPDPEINAILHRIREHIGDASLLDCATNKSGFAATLQEIARGVSVCSTHPMVRSATHSRGQNVLLMPVGDRAEKAMVCARELYERLGMDIHLFEFEKHGELMVLLQAIPHLIQRVLLEVLGTGLDIRGMHLGDLTRFAPANFMMTELAMGRVATQRSDVSAGILCEALQTSFGKQIFQRMKDVMQDIEQASDKVQLENLFDRTIQSLDPDGNWRTVMQEKTDVILERTGNLKRRSCQVYAPNRPGILAQISNVLHLLFNIDMNALDSNIHLSEETGKEEVRFDIGLADKSCMDEQRLSAALNALGARITVIHDPRENDA